MSSTAVSLTRSAPRLNHHRPGPSSTYLLEHHRYKRHVKKAYMMLQDLKLPLSRRIIQTLAQEPYPITVTQIFIKLRTEQCIVSRHLSRLLKHRIIGVIKKGRHHYYYLNRDRIEEINGITSRFIAAYYS